MTDKLEGRRPSVPEVQAIIDRAVDEGLYEHINFLHAIVEDDNYEGWLCTPSTGAAISHALALIVGLLTASQRGRLKYDSHEAYSNALQ